MASIIKRNNSISIVYGITDNTGKRVQKWEAMDTMEQAKARKKEIEYKESIGAMIVPQCSTLNQLLKDYVKLYGKNKWALSTYEANVGLIEHYISPVIGKLKISDINPRVLEKYYGEMLHYKAVKSPIGKKHEEYVTAKTVHNINKLLKSCFEQAIKWEIMERNPCKYATLPKATAKKREIWTADTIYKAVELCTDERLKLAIHLAFSASLRIGEMLALTWDCVDISQESINHDCASIKVNKEIQRVSRSAMDTLEQKDVVQIFPAASSKTKTLLILKTPKTQSSIRKVFLPKTVAEMLVQWKLDQEELKLALGEEYSDYQLVFAGPIGLPIEASVINNAWRKLIKDNDLPEVVFHSLRHSSITYKLKLNGGNVKAVQGDSGHAQANMVTDVYSHILDEDRRTNAQLFEDAFYSPEQQEIQKKKNQIEESLGNETLEKLLASPELANLVKALVAKVS